MRISEKYSYSKYRNNDPSRPVGSGKIFVSDKVKYGFNPVVHLPAKFWGNIALLVIFFGVLWLIFYSRYFAINEIIVQGNNLVKTEDIANAAGKGENIFRYDILSAKERIISESPIIEDVEIYRGIPNALKIVVLERKPSIVWQSGENYYLLDESGYADKQILPTDYPELFHVRDNKNMKVSLGAKIISSEFIDFIKILNGKFNEKTNAKISGFYVEETTLDLYVLTDSGFFVKFDTTRNVDKQLDDLKNILIAFRANIHEYIDVRVNGWAYYK